MKTTGIIYRIWNIKSGKSYIGKTYRCFYIRIDEHIKQRDRPVHKNRPIYRALNKYGLEAFSAEILGTFCSSILDEQEQYFIKLYKSFGSTGYNATQGGEGTKLLSVDTELLIGTYTKYGNIAQRLDI